MLDIKLHIGYDGEDPTQNRLAAEQYGNESTVLLQKQKMLKREMKMLQENLSTMFDGRIAALEQMQE